MKHRTRARSIALQVLYELDIADHKPGEALQLRFEDEDLKEDRLEEFARQIVMGVLPLEEDLDNLIAEHAPEWPMDQVAVIDRNILRIALWELGIFQDTPIKVVINEAVELAKVYGSDSSPRFVNGVLGSLADHQNEIIQAFNAKRGQNPGTGES
jgi:N utilization substance protein B